VNLGYRLRFQPSDEAILDGTLDRTIEQVVRVLAERFGARMRD
jgi:phenylalanyl-tRNA synthetase beta subunit